MKEQEMDEIFLTANERRRKKRHEAILATYHELNDGRIKKWRLYSAIAKKHGVTPMGVYKIIKKEIQVC